jgi:hypothetical protein
MFAAVTVSVEIRPPHFATAVLLPTDLEIVESCHCDQEFCALSEDGTALSLFVLFLPDDALNDQERRHPARLPPDDVALRHD